MLTPLRPRHIGGQPALEALLQGFYQNRPLGAERQRVAPGGAERAHRHARLAGARHHGGAAAASSVAPMPAAIAISASATARPPSETSCTAVATPSAISARTKSPLRFSVARSTGGGAPSSRPQMSRR